MPDCYFSLFVWPRVRRFFFAAFANHSHGTLSSGFWRVPADAESASLLIQTVIAGNGFSGICVSLS